MTYLTTEYIKDHSRICNNAEDAYLERIGSAAEHAILNLCNRTIEDIYEQFGEVPPDLIHATLELVDHFYTHRGVTENMQANAVPCSIDMLVKPYMQLV